MDFDDTPDAMTGAGGYAVHHTVVPRWLTAVLLGIFAVGVGTILFFLIWLIRAI